MTNDNPFARARRDSWRKVLIGTLVVAIVAVLVWIKACVPERQREARERLRRPAEDIWNAGELARITALRDAVTTGNVVPRPDLGRCPCGADSMKEWVASENAVDFAYGNTFARGVPGFDSEQDVVAWAQNVAAWDRELDVVSDAFARNLRYHADPKATYDPTYRTMHLYVWDFRERKIVCAAHIDLGSGGDAGQKQTVTLEGGAQVEVTAVKVGGGELSVAGPPR